MWLYFNENAFRGVFDFILGYTYGYGINKKELSFYAFNKTVLFLFSLLIE